MGVRGAARIRALLWKTLLYVGRVGDEPVTRCPRCNVGELKERFGRAVTLPSRATRGLNRLPLVSTIVRTCTRYGNGCPYEDAGSYNGAGRFVIDQTLMPIGPLMDSWLTSDPAVHRWLLEHKPPDQEHPKHDPGE